VTQKQARPDIEVLESLEPIELLPDVEGGDAHGDGSTRSQCAREIEDAIRLYSNPNLAVMFLSCDFTIISFTPRTSLLFQDYHSLARKPFFNVFSPSLDQAQLKELFISLKSFERGNSWSGVLKHKTKTTKTLYTRTNIIPVFSDSRAVSGFLVLFDDVTSQHHSQLRATFTGILEAAKLKDNDTGMHNERVSYYCRKMAQYLYSIGLYPQIDPDFIENISFLAAMHDVGKIGTPDYILQKPGKLTDLEWEIMREHTVNGTFILASYPEPMAKEIALSHHEWWNGTGYPFKLEGEMIPLAARIVTIADVYDALRMRRTYKAEYTHEEAVKKILAGKGEQFDPVLISVFEKIHGEFAEVWDLLRDSESYTASDRDRSREHAGLF